MDYFPKKKWTILLFGFLIFNIIISTILVINYMSLYVFIVEKFLFIEIIGVISIILLFHIWSTKILSAPNLEARQIIDQILSFRKYLSDDFSRQEDISPEQFEYYLPYAIALGVERDWIRGIQDLSYELVWYSPQTANTLTAVVIVDTLSNDFARAVLLSTPSLLTINIQNFSSFNEDSEDSN